jgi:colicin import membrane protein
MKERNSAIAQRKIEERATRKAIVNREQQRVAMRRQKLRDERKVKGTKSNESKLDYVKQQRQEKIARQEQGKRRKAEEIAKARLVKEKIRQREVAMRQKREREEKERRAKQAAEYKRRLKDERSKQLVADEEISKMEEEEMRLIERLRATQDLQRQAYATLEAALVSK